MTTASTPRADRTRRDRCGEWLRSISKNLSESGHATVELSVCRCSRSSTSGRMFRSHHLSPGPIAVDTTDDFTSEDLYPGDGEPVGTVAHPGIPCSGRAGGGPRPRLRRWVDYGDQRGPGRDAGSVVPGGQLPTAASAVPPWPTPVHSRWGTRSSSPACAPVARRQTKSCASTLQT